MTITTTLKVGIASLEQYKARTVAITRGDYKPSPDEPKVWFQSI
jgi:predicted transcriptional regulator